MSVALKNGINIVFKLYLVTIYHFKSICSLDVGELFIHLCIYYFFYFIVFISTRSSNEYKCIKTYCINYLYVAKMMDVYL